MFSRLVPGRYSQVPFVEPKSAGWLKRLLDSLFSRKQ